MIDNISAALKFFWTCVALKLVDDDDDISPVSIVWTRCKLLCAAGILRYQVDFQTMELPDDVDNDFDLDDY